MKTLLTILIFSAIGCTTQKPITLKITYINRQDSITEVQARSSYKWYGAKCKDLPDSVILGSVLIADPTKRPDTCKCVFKRVK